MAKEIIRVLQTTNDLAKFLPISGAELKNSSLFGLEQYTLCARFVTFRFTNHLYDWPRHVLLEIGGSKDLLSSFDMAPNQIMDSSFIKNVGGKWKTGNVVGFTESDKYRYFDIWNIGQDELNTVCIIASSRDMFYRTIVNGVIVYEGLDYQEHHKEKDKNLFFMGE